MKTILVVDDKPDNLLIISNFLTLSNKNIKVLTGQNGKEACNIAELEIPDLIIMDWKMPIMSGIQATRYLKSRKITEDIPIIITSGIMFSSNDLQLAFDVGAIDFLRKPIDRSELAARVRSALVSQAAKYKSHKIVIENLDKIAKDVQKHLTGEDEINKHSKYEILDISVPKIEIGEDVFAELKQLHAKHKSHIVKTEAEADLLKAKAKVQEAFAEAIRVGKFENLNELHKQRMYDSWNDETDKKEADEHNSENTHSDSHH